VGRSTGREKVRSRKITGSGGKPPSKVSISAIHSTKDRLCISCLSPYTSPSTLMNQKSEGNPGTCHSAAVTMEKLVSAFCLDIEILLKSHNHLSFHSFKHVSEKVATGISKHVFRFFLIVPLNQVVTLSLHKGCTWLRSPS
jgi:hypothetical protein